MLKRAQANANKLSELNKILAAQADLDKAEKNLTGLSSWRTRWPARLGRSPKASSHFSC